MVIGLGIGIASIVIAFLVALFNMATADKETTFVVHMACMAVMFIGMVVSLVCGGVLVFEYIESWR